jgi:hypothetical protein
VQPLQLNHIFGLRTNSLYHEQTKQIFAATCFDISGSAGCRSTGAGGELKIYFENNNSFWSWKDRDATVYVTVTNVKSIKSSSGSDVTGETIIVSDYLEVESSSGADLKLQVRARTLRAESSSGSDMELSGEAEFFEGRSSSGSDLDAMDLVAKKAKVRASSGSDLAITVTDDIEADASSGSDISYSGRPQYVNIDESSGGDVRRRNY